MYGLFPRLGERMHQLAGTLSGGEQQMVAMARALCDEPTAPADAGRTQHGACPADGAKDFRYHTRLAALGMSILLVEQNAKLALEVAQRGYVMESGRITLSGAAGALLGSDAVQRAYLGG